MKGALNTILQEAGVRLPSHADPDLEMLTGGRDYLRPRTSGGRTDKSATLRKIEEWWGKPLHSIVSQTYRRDVCPAPELARMEASRLARDGHRSEAQILDDCADALAVAQSIKQRRSLWSAPSQP